MLGIFFGSFPFGSSDHEFSWFPSCLCKCHYFCLLLFSQHNVSMPKTSALNLLFSVSTLLLEALRTLCRLLQRASQMGISRLDFFLELQKHLPICPSLVAQRVKNLPTKQETQVGLLGWEDPLVKGMATHFSNLAWRIPWTEEPGGRQSMGVAKS